MKNSYLFLVKLSKHLKQLLLLFCFLLTTSALADDASIDFSNIEITPHELATTQVLSEICPYLLDRDRQLNFGSAYESYLQLLIPDMDTKSVMNYFNNQKQYRTILEGVRRWTLSYSTDENRALCIEIADTPATLQQEHS